MRLILLRMEDDVNTILTMRLVCRAWKDACLECTRLISLIPTRDYDLSVLCKMLPSLREVTLCLYTDSVCLQPLSSFCQLTHLWLEFRYLDNGQDPVLDMAFLPISLQALSAIGADLHSTQSVQCVGLTSLTIQQKRYVAAEVLRMLPHLPKLQVDLCEPDTPRFRSLN